MCFNISRLATWYCCYMMATKLLSEERKGISRVESPTHHFSTRVINFQNVSLDKIACLQVFHACHVIGFLGLLIFLHIHWPQTWIVLPGQTQIISYCYMPSLCSWSWYLCLINGLLLFACLVHPIYCKYCSTRKMRYSVNLSSASSFKL